MGIPANLSSVPAQTPYTQYVASNGQTVFPYPFVITQDSDLVVVVGGVTLPTDQGYTLSGVGNSTGGNVTFNAGQTAGAIITLYRDITIERITQFSQNSGFSSTAFNAEYNNIYLILQQLQEALAFALQIPSTNNPAPTTRLTPASYANKYLSFDANGNPTPALLTSSGTITGALIASLFQPQTQAEANAGVVPTNLFYVPGNVLRYGADPAGIVDSATAINNALLSNGTVYAPAGTYLCGSTLNMQTGQTFYGDGRATVITSTTGSQVQIEMSSCVGSTLRDLKIVNTAGSGSGHPAAVYLLNCTACTVERVEGSGMWGFGIWLDCSNACTVYNNYLHDFQGAGNFGDVAIYCLSSTTAGAVENIIAYNKCFGTTNAFGIQLQDPDQATASTGFPRRNLVTGNRIGAHIAYGTVGYMSGSASSPPPPTDTNNQWVNNYIENVSGTAFSDAGAGMYFVGIGNGGTVITGNTIFNCCTATTTRSLAPAGIGVSQVGAGLTAAVISNNHISGMTQGDGILITSSPGGAEITGNTILMPSSNNASGPGGATLVGNGIHVVASSNVDIGPNNVKAFGTGAPVQVFTAGFNCLDITFTGGNYSALNTNPASAMQVLNNSSFVIERLTINGGNYNNVSTVAGVAAMNLSAVTIATLSGVTMNAFGTAPGLSIQNSTQVRVGGGSYVNTGGSVAVFTAGTCTNCFLDKSVDWGNTLGSTGSFMSNSGSGFNVEANFSGMPSAGSWVAGDKAIHLGVTAGNAKAWTRVTTGSGNVLATDWISDGNL